MLVILQRVILVIAIQAIVTLVKEKMGEGYF